MKKISTGFDHSIFYVVKGSISSIFLLGLVQFFMHQYSNPVFWKMLIAALACSIVGSSFLMLFNVRKLYPIQKWLTPSAAI